ncbi:MAG TPA: CHAT domain-containing protein [Terracidiphilus sp.]|jgi:hypothetical protein|nr:CHAT domain-containing protein [Terracidiphilus sp.]
MSQSTPPVVFVAFANPDNPAGDTGLARLQLSQEAQNIYAALAPGEQLGGWTFLNGAETRRASLIDSFTANRVVLFHYGGHSNSQGLWLPAESPDQRLVDGRTLDGFLSSQHSLQLAFLNSCQNHEWAQRLSASVPYVVATVTPVNDDAAVTFSNAFYRALAQEQNTVDDAFEIASNAVRLAYQGLFAASTPQVEAPHASMRSTDELLDDAPRNTAAFPWVLYKSSSARPWRLTDSAADPLVGMPSLPQRYSDSLPECPYVTIKGHTKNDAALFFGRNDEIRGLYDWVLSPHRARPIGLFYGQSGTGKSSLLNAGLLPRLGNGFRVAYRRRSTDLIDDFHSTIAEVLQVTPPLNPDNAWWNSLVQQWLARAEPSLIILDQLEEAITHFVPPQDGNTPSRYKTPLDEIGAFIALVKDLFGSQAPGTPARLLLSFRKEYLAEISGNFAGDATDNSSPLLERFWLDRLGPDAIAQIITGPADSRLTRDKYKIAFPDRAQLVSLIAGELLRGDSPIATVLEIILNQMWKDAKLNGDGARIYDTDLYKQLEGRDNPLQGFYDQTMVDLSKRKDIPDIAQGLELDLLYEHTSEYGTSIPVPLSTLTEKYNTSLDIPKLLGANKDLYVLVEPAAEPGGSKAEEDKSPAVETTALAHDTLAHLVRYNFMHSQLPGARARRILEGRVREGQDNKKGALLDKVDFRTVNRGLPHMRKLTGDEKNLLAASRAYHRRAMMRSFALMLLLPVLLIGTLVASIIHLRQQELTAGNDAEANLDSNSQILAIAEALEAVRIQQRWSFLLRLDFTHNNTTVNQSVLDHLHSALALREVYRSQIDPSFRNYGKCAVMLDKNDHPLFSLRGSQAYYGGFALPANADLQPFGCDPGSGTIVFLNTKQNSGMLWVAGKSTQMPMPPGRQSLFAISKQPHGTIMAYEEANKVLMLLNGVIGKASQLPGVTSGNGTELAITPDGHYLMCFLASGRVATVDLTQPNPIATPTPFAADNFAYSSIGGQDVLALSGKNLLAVYRPSDGKTFDYSDDLFMNGPIENVEMSADGSALAIVTSGNVNLWSLPPTLEQDPSQKDPGAKTPPAPGSRQADPSVAGPSTHTDLFDFPDSPDLIAMSADSKYLVSAVRTYPPVTSESDMNDPNRMVATSASLHLWTLHPYLPEDLKKIQLPLPLFDMGCDMIGNFIDDMAASQGAMIAGTENIDYTALSKACKTRKKQQNTMGKAKAEAAKAKRAPAARP